MTFATAPKPYTVVMDLTRASDCEQSSQTLGSYYSVESARANIANNEVDAPTTHTRSYRIFKAEWTEVPEPNDDLAELRAHRAWRRKVGASS